MEFIKSQFKDEIAYQNSISETIGINYQIFEQLENQYQKPFNKMATVDFSFVSNSKEKLENLVQVFLDKYGAVKTLYEPLENNLHMTSWTIEKKEVEIQKMNEWVFELLIIGQKHDCLFNGWGTFPES